LRRYGVMGQRLFRLARSIDDRDGHPNRSGQKSVSAETTFSKICRGSRISCRSLRNLPEMVSRRLKKSGIASQTVVLKLKTADFKSQRTL